FQAEDGIRDFHVTGVQTCALPISGNRNFEARVHPQVKMNFLMSPMLVVAYALVGRVDVDLTNDPIGYDPNGQPVYLADIWPSQRSEERRVGKEHSQRLSQ